MSDIHVYVAASVFNPNDRESSGHTSPKLRTNHHILTENTLLFHDCVGTVAPAATSRAMTHVVGQELA